MIHENLKINEAGELVIGGVSCTKLAEQYGTPLYVMNELTIRNNCKTFKNALIKHYENSLVLYASKAFNCLEMCRIISSEGLGIDVVSGGELYTAIKSGFDKEKIFFHGNNKTLTELKFAVENNVGVIVVDNIHELNMLSEIAVSANKSPKIMFRIKPGIDAHTHDFVKTGQIDSKFGFALENGEAFEAVKIARNAQNLDLIGMHCHIGSQIFDTDPFVLASTVMLEFYLKCKNELQMEFSHLNLGGGFGIKYINTDNPEHFEDTLSAVAKNIKAFCSNYSLELPCILIEPGRAIAGEAGTTLYTVGAIKEIKGVRNYISVNGGMTDNPRYALYKSEYTVMLGNKANNKCDYVATIAGKCCESGDLLQENVSIPHPEIGDTLAVLCTGAYNYSMSSNYNRTPRPAVVLVNNGTSKVIIKSESFEDIIRNDI